MNYCTTSDNGLNNIKGETSANRLNNINGVNNARINNSASEDCYGNRESDNRLNNSASDNCYVKMGTNANAVNYNTNASDYNNFQETSGQNYIDKTVVTENNNYINENVECGEMWRKGNVDECYGQSLLNQGYRRSQHNTNHNNDVIITMENHSYIDNNVTVALENNKNKNALNLRTNGFDESYELTDWQSSDPEITELCNVNNNNRTTDLAPGDQEYTSDTTNRRTLRQTPTMEYYRFVNHDYGPYWMVKSVEKFRDFVNAIFILKYYKKGDDIASYVRNVFYPNPNDTYIERIYKNDRKPNCTPCQYCCFLTCFTCVAGAVLPPTPSPYSSPNRFSSKGQKSAITPTSSTTLTERQYHSLYRDFKHASQIELRGQDISGREKINNSQLNSLVEKEMRRIIHTFTSEVFTTLVEEYLKLFEEMVKGLILLKETGITLEDICSIGEENHAYYCQQATRTNIKPALSSCRPYNITEFEQLLLDELIKQFEGVRDTSKCSHKMSGETDHNVTSGNGDICDCEHSPVNNNPYLTFLTEINCHSPPSCNTEDFSQILHTEKQMFLKSCLKLLRDNKYFRFHSQSSLESEHFYAAMNECSLVNEDEMYNMSVRIYNQTICHVQSAICAIFKSMKYGEQGKKILLPPTPNRTRGNKRVVKISESKNLIKKSLSDYLKSTSLSASSDEVFINKSVNRDDTFQDGLTLKYKETDEEFQTMPPIKYESDIKHHIGQNEYRKRNNKTIQYDNIERDFPPLRQEITQQHPNLEYAKNHTKGFTQNSQENSAEIGRSYNIQDIASTDFPLQNTEKPCIPAEKVQELEKTVLLPPEEREAWLSTRPLLFKRRKNNVRVICVLNNYKPEITHVNAIDFLKKLEIEGGILHYPQCSENNFLTKIDGPTFCLSVCCADCRQELAPSQKLEAFKSEPKNTHRSRFMSHVISKSSSPYYFPVRCGSCGYFLSDPQKVKKQHLFVPFHSAVKSHICSSWLKTHQCEIGSSDKEYAGCPSDTLNTSHNMQNINEENAKECQYSLNKSPKHIHMPRSRSLPALVNRKDINYRDTMEDVNQMTRMNESLKFEDAITNILNMWTYEMIDYEKGAASPHLRSQILNYRKSFSIFIKKDIREKLYYRHILSVFKRVDNYESPILEIRDHVSNQRSKLNCKIMKKSRSCHSKFNYETTSATRRSKYESLEYNNKNVRQQLLDPKKVMGSTYLRSESINRKNMARPLSLHSQLKHPPTTQRRRSCSYTESVYKENVSSQINAWKNELQELQKSIDSPVLSSETLNRKNTARPLSLHSELKQKPLTDPRRRRSSCSFTTEFGYKDISNEMTAWKNELLKLQKSAQSPHLGFENFKTCLRPLSLHAELKQKPSSSQRRRSCSFTESVYKKDVSSQIKNDLQELPKSVKKSPNIRFRSINRINSRDDCLRSEPKRRFASSVAQRPKSEPFINIEDFSFQLNQSKQELLKLQKSFESQQLRSETENCKPMIKVGSLHSEPNHKTEASRRRQPETILNKEEFSTELNAWKHELLELQKSVEYPHWKSEPLNRKFNIRAGSLDAEPKVTLKATHTHFPKSEIDDSLTELKTWNHRLRELERDATSPHMRSERLNRKIKTRTVSLHTESKRTTTESRNRPKSESVLYDYSTELETWKHKLLTLEEDARNPQPETLNRKNMAKSRSFNSELKNKTSAHRVNIESMNNKGDTSRRNTWVAPPPEPTNARTTSQYKSPVHRYCAAPRQLSALPHRNTRRHSHYETTGNFVPLLTDRRMTRLDTHTRNPVSTNCADPVLIYPRNEGSDGFLKPDEGTTRSRFFSQ